MQKNKFTMLAWLVISLSLAGCGSGDSVGGNVADFKTSRVTASAATPRLEADLITGNTCSATGTDGGTVDTETVDFTIATTATTSNPLPLALTGYTVSYMRKNADAPLLDPITSNFSAPVDGNTITVPVITDRQKIDLINRYPSFPCSLNIYQYDVTVSFKIVEVGADENSKDVNAGFVMAIADRNN